jgi:hypothetical protein
MIEKLKEEVQATIDSFSYEFNNKRSRNALCYHLNIVFENYNLTEVWEDCTEGETADDYSSVMILSEGSHLTFNDWYELRKD